MAAKRTRVVVWSDGTLRELFGVSESTKGTLTVMVKGPGPTERSTWHVTSTKYSIHATLGSTDGGFTIHETRLFSDGRQLERYAYVTPHEGSAMLPVFGEVVGIMPVQPEASLKDTKQLTMLYHEDIVGSLFYVLVVSREGLSKEDLTGLGLQVRELPFSRYTLFVLSGIFPNFGLTTSLTVPVMSRAPRLNGVEMEGMPEDIGPPISPVAAQIPIMVSNLIDDLAELAQRMIRKEATATGNPEAIAMGIRACQHFDRYLSHPRDLLPRDRMQARAPRLLHPRS
jgi:hypothetical protein